MKEKLLKNLKAKGLKTDVFQYDLFVTYDLLKTPLTKPYGFLTIFLKVYLLN